MKRVMYVIPSLSVGGTEWQFIHLLKRLSGDHNIAVICTHHDGALGGDVRRIGTHLRIIRARSGWDFRMKRRIARIVRSFRPDILHTFMFGFDWYANQAARACGVPVVISSRRQLATWKKRRHVWMQQKGNALVDCIVANSKAVAYFAIEQEHENPNLFRIIHNGIEADDFVSSVDVGHVRKRHRIPFNTHVIGIVANLSPVKDYPLFIDMAHELLRRRADVHFMYIGTGPMREAIEQRIKMRGLADNFTRIATVSELADLYALMDVSVLCSKSEGFPNVIMESMAAGTPVVATAVGGIPEMLKDGVTGRLVLTRTPGALADAVCWTLDRPEESRAMTERASQHVRRELSMEKMVNSYRSLYAELLDNAHGKGT